MEKVDKDKSGFIEYSGGEFQALLRNIFKYDNLWERNNSKIVLCDVCLVAVFSSLAI